MALTADQLNVIYNNVLQRNVDFSGIQFFANRQDISDAQVRQQIELSNESQTLVAPIVRLYDTVLGRVPDAGGLKFFVNAFRAGSTLEQIAQQLLNSAEFQGKTTATAGAVDVTDLTNTNQLVTDAFQSILGRSPSAGEFAYFQGRPAAQIVAQISVSPEAQQLQAANVVSYLDSAALGSPNTGSLEAQGSTNPNTPSNGGQTFTLTNNLDGPGATAPAANTTGTGGNDTYIADNNTLTSDAINAGGGTDTLRVTNNANANYSPTLTSVERVEFATLGGTANLNLANSTGVQTIAQTNGAGSLVVNQAGTLVALEVNNTTGGATQINYNAATVAGATDAQAISFNTAISAGVTVNGIETINVTSNGANTTAPTNQIASLNSNTLSTVNFSGAGSIAVAAALTGAATVSASAATGNVSVVLDTNKAVTATGGAGNDTFNFGTGFTVADTVNGGTGTDTVRVANAAATDLTAAAAAAPFNALTSVEKVAFDTAAGGNGGVTVNGSTFTNAGITNIEFNTVGADVINNAGSARTYEIGTANGGLTTVALNNTATTLNLALLGTDPSTTVANDGVDADTAGLTITTSGVNSTTTPVTVNLSSQGDLADGFFTTGTFAEGEVNQTGLVTVASGSTVNVTGAGNLAIFGGTAGAVTEGFDNNVTLNASAVTGNTILVGSSFDAVTGTAGSPAVPGNNGPDGAPGGGDDVAPVAAVPGTNTVRDEGIDTFTLGSGRDIVVFTDGLASGQVEFATPTGGVATATGNILVDTIVGFTAGEGGDVLFRGTNLALTAPTAGDYTAIATGTQTAINTLAGAAATLQAAANAAANDASVGWTAFSFQGETYALFDNAQANTGYENGVDTLVRLTGVTVANLTAANFEVL